MSMPVRAEPAPPITPGDRAFFGHPRGLSTLFFTEMWERFSYYGMRALLILFMTAPVAMGGLGFNAATAGAVYGTYTAMVYLSNLPGGWIADRITGQRKAILYGGILIAFGLNPNHAWHWGFGAAGIGMTFGLIQYVMGSRKLGDAGLHPVKPASPQAAAKLKQRAIVGFGGGLLVIVALAAGLITGML